MHLLLKILLLFQGFCFAFGFRDFNLGRSKGGNIGSPPLINLDEEVPEPKLFDQIVDHSDPSNKDSYKQRYFVNEKYFSKNAPATVFLMLGGEGRFDARWMITGAWIDYAKNFNALCFGLEHRFYGDSHPTKDVSTKNLQYLTTIQALKDVANFITEMNQAYKLAKDTKWVVFGGSYSGSLAAWMRLKFPHLVHAAVSSSGPLLAVADFREYYKIVVKALHEKTGSNKCQQQITKAHLEIKALMSAEPETLERDFKVCQKFSESTTNDIKNFYNIIAENFADLVQYNEDNRIGSDENSRNITINTVCGLMTIPVNIPAYKRLAKFNAMMLKKNNQTCMDYSYDNMITELRKTSWGKDEARQWMYQTCTEFGFFQTSSAEYKIFGNEFELDFFIQQCQDVFGKKYDKKFLQNSIDWTNTEYGGLNYTVNHVIFVQGTIDPWHALGITYSNNPIDMPALYIKGTAHCANMYPARDSDLPDLKQARTTIAQHLRLWLQHP
ncbi:hypothetical protein ACJJTC_000806 [Scirpophaga incertulas]